MGGALHDSGAVKAKRGGGNEGGRVRGTYNPDLRPNPRRSLGGGEVVVRVRGAAGREADEAPRPDMLRRDHLEG